MARSRSSHPARLVRLAALVAGGALCAACSSSPQALTAAEVLSSTPATRTVQLRLNAAQTPRDSGFNFDGYGHGQMTVQVPVGWTVEVTCTNRSATFTHSCAVVQNSPPGLHGAPVAFAGAVSANPRTGLGDGQSSVFRFVASRVGRYRISCLVTGHELDGMWDWFVVTAGGSPTVRLSR